MPWTDLPTWLLPIALLPPWGLGMIHLVRAYLELVDERRAKKDEVAETRRPELLQLGSHMTSFFGGAVVTGVRRRGLLLTVVHREAIVSRGRSVRAQAREFCFPYPGFACELFTAPWSNGSSNVA